MGILPLEAHAWGYSYLAISRSGILAPISLKYLMVPGWSGDVAYLSVISTKFAPFTLAMALA